MLLVAQNDGPLSIARGRKREYYTTITNYLVMCKVDTDVGGIK